jgi:hypothetical protein
LFVYFRQEKREGISIMSLRRRDKKTPDPPEEREIPEGRGRQEKNPEVKRDLHDIRTRLDVEIKKRCTTGIGDVSESESEDDVGHEEE